MKREIKLLLIFLLMVPLGLLGGEAWGEWGLEELKKMLGFVPAGLEKIYGLWKAPLSDYSLPHAGDLPSYLVSALLGAGAVFLSIYLMGRLRK